ncbi:MAG: prenyltransferase/squalene oxidase repeat-containing protein [Kiritimatiellia bacterium]
MKLRVFVLPSLILTSAFALGMTSGPAPETEKQEQGRSSTLVSSQQPAGTVHLSLSNEAESAINRGLDWLAKRQKQNGAWSNEKFPALTALAMQSFLNVSYQGKERIIGKAVNFILSCVQEDGGIYREVSGRKGGGLSNYNTAICMTALHKTGDKELVPVILEAREFIAGSQHFGGDIYEGGFGYDRSTKRAYADLLNTYYAATAMAETRKLEDKRPSVDKRVSVDWAKTVKFIEQMQNKPETGDDAGGFFYKPGQSKAGTRTNAQGSVVFRSYGSMTYAGMLALIYADVSRDDVRVRSAFDWAVNHWGLRENPGMGNQGLYFFYNVLTRALDAYGAEAIPLPSGKTLNWREETVKALVSRQIIDPDTGHGYWKNTKGRYWENDPVLCTSYSIIALKTLVNP